MIRLISATVNEGDNTKNENILHRSAQCDSSSTSISVEGTNIELADLSKCHDVRPTPKKSKSTTLHDLEAVSLYESPTQEIRVGPKQKMELETPSEDVCVLQDEVIQQ